VSTLATTADRGTIVRAVCVREWRESLGNRLLVGMTILPPLVILAVGVWLVYFSSVLSVTTVRVLGAEAQ